MRKSSLSAIAWRTTRRLLLDAQRFISLGFRSRSQLAAENLFLRKQLALYAERGVRPCRADEDTRIALVVLARFFDWRAALTIVKPETLIRWHRRGFRLFWRWKSQMCGRPPLPVDVQRLIATMARPNATWGEERIAAELLLKLGIRVSPRTVRRYIPTTGRPRGPRGRASSQRWSTFVRNHAEATLACDFFVTITAAFRMVYLRSSRVQAGITLLPGSESPPHRPWRDCITRIGWSHWRLDRTRRCWPGCNYCGRQDSRAKQTPDKSPRICGPGKPRQATHRRRSIGERRPAGGITRRAGRAAPWPEA
jgi:hypothetical protein